MSNQVSRGVDPDPKVRFLSIALAVVLVLFWAFLLGWTGWFFNIRENTYAGSLLNWIARWHVLVLHAPIALVFLTIAIEIFGKVKGFEHIRASTTFILWLTLLGSLIATVFGFLLMEVEEVSGRAMNLHMWTGLAVVVCSLFALIFKLKESGMPYAIALAAGALSVTAAGHYGGAMVHEADYLSEFAPKRLQPLILLGLSDPKRASESAATPETPVEIPVGERLVYTDYVVPILEKSCNECHCENKVKGKLRMDTHELLLAGAEGSDVLTVAPGKPDDSGMIVRVTLPSDDEEFMPPKGDPLKAEEIALLKWWIQAGAKTDTTVAQLGEDPSILTTIAALDIWQAEAKAAQLAAADKIETPSIWDGLSDEEKSARLAKVQSEAERLNVSVMPVSAEDDRLRISVLNGASEFGDEQLLLFEPVAERIAALDLAKSQVTDEGLKVLAAMKELEKLHLENTKITDAGIQHLTPLKKLEYLNLYATDVSNAIFDFIKEIPSLRKVYVWQTKVDTEEARRFEKSVNLEINTGLDLEQAAAEAKAKKDAEEAEAARIKAEADAKAKAAAEAAARKKAEEEAARKKVEAEATTKKKAEEEAAAKAKLEAVPAPAPVQPAPPAVPQ